jgi:hypothetical protein
MLATHERRHYCVVANVLTDACHVSQTTTALGVSTGRRWDTCVWRLARICWVSKAKWLGRVSVFDDWTKWSTTVLDTHASSTCVRTAPGQFTVHNFPCSEDGKNCVIHKKAVDTEFYEDPSQHVEAVQRRLQRSALRSN